MQEILDRHGNRILVSYFHGLVANIHYFPVAGWEVVDTEGVHFYEALGDLEGNDLVSCLNITQGRTVWFERVAAPSTHEAPV